MVVPTYNRATLLERLLVSLQEQTFPPDSYEVVVVDDGSTDATVPLLERMAAQVPCLAVVRQANLGPSRARNAGLARARGDVVAFIDSDCLATPGWLSALADTFFADPSVVGVEGRTVTQLEGVTPFTHQVVNETGGLFATCNMAYRREVLDRLGGFDPDFFYGHEDTELALRARSMGKLVFQPAALVVHPPIPVSFWRMVGGMKTSVDNELILYLKTRGEYVRLHGCGPLWTLVYRLGIRAMAGQLGEHARWLGQDPWTYARFALGLLAQRVYLLWLLPGFVGRLALGRLPRGPARRVERPVPRRA